jgi:hypothetical protein
MLCLTITGFDAHPDHVTETLGLTPTETALKGELSGAGRVHRSSGWWLEAHEPKLTDGDQHDRAVDVLVGQLRGKAEHFRTPRETINPVRRLLS